ncbi:response regulator transcription factor [Hansschlegelia sp. KR7-227]|jgi:two-component system response regulator FixJ|uniref:response regulator transcription factor n=1 Tax=Hansschlegelia sp. KR7-227 TaxID=3400914 RepID=UPI003C0894C3
MSVHAGTVIVVDDDEAVRSSMRFALELEGLIVRLYEDGAALLEAGDLPEKACLLIDQYMPGMEGMDLIARLRDRHVRLPVILMTAKATEDLRRRAVLAGIELVVEKPFRDAALMEGIHRALAARGGARPGN